MQSLAQPAEVGQQSRAPLGIAPPPGFVPAVSLSANNLRAAMRQGVRPRPAGPYTFHRWRVPSVTTPGAEYDLEIRFSGPSIFTRCACPSGQARRGCKHAIAAVSLLRAHPWIEEAARQLAAGRAEQTILDNAARAYRYAQEVRDL